MPVLSKIKVSTFPIISRAAPDLIKIPFLEADVMAEITEIGVAKTKAHGQNTTNTVTARMASPVKRYVKKATNKEAGADCNW